MTLPPCAFSAPLSVPQRHHAPLLSIFLSFPAAPALPPRPPAMTPPTHCLAWLLFTGIWYVMMGGISLLTRRLG